MWGKWGMERWGNMPKEAQAETDRAGTPNWQCVPEKLTHGAPHCVPPPFHVVTSVQAELRASPNPGSQGCHFLCPSRLNAPSFWETVPLETSQEALQRGNGSRGLGGTWGTGKKSSAIALPSFPAALLSRTCSKPWSLWRRSWSQSGGPSGASSAYTPCTPSSSGEP